MKPYNNTNSTENMNQVNNHAQASKGTAAALFDIDGETFRKGDRVTLSYVDPYEGGLFTAVGTLTNFSPSMCLAEVTTDEGEKKYAHYTAAKHMPADTANNENTDAQANKEPQTVTDKDGRQCYAFILYVGGEITRVLTCGYWSTHNDAQRTAEGMAIAARAFKKTAAVAVYALEDNDIYQFIFSKDMGSRDRIICKIHRSRLESGTYIAPTQEEQKEYFSLGNSDIYAGAECMPVGWNETKHAARLEEGARVLCIHYGIFGTIDHHNTRDGKITYVVKYDEPQRRADGSTFQFEEYDREGITTNYDPTTGKEIEGNAQHYRETLCASWWGGDDVPRRLVFGGQNLVCICKGEYWDLTTDDGKGTQHDLTLDELADVLAQYYADDQKARAARVA